MQNHFEDPLALRICTVEAVALLFEVNLAQTLPKLARTCLALALTRASTLTLTLTLTQELGEPHDTTKTMVHAVVINNDALSGRLAPPGTKPAQGKGEGESEGTGKGETDPIATPGHGAKPGQSPANPPADESRSPTSSQHALPPPPPQQPEQKEVVDCRQGALPPPPAPAMSAAAQSSASDSSLAKTSGDGDAGDVGDSLNASFITPG